MGHNAQRTCIGCRKVADRSALVRLVRDARGVVAVDPRGGAAGRGAWLHADRACVEAAVGGARFERAFRGAAALVPKDQITNPIDRLWSLIRGVVADGTSRRLEP